MYTTTSKKFSNFIQKLIVNKVRELRKNDPKDGFWYKRYNSDDDCFQAAVMVLEHEHKVQSKAELDDHAVLASEIFLASDEHFLSQVCSKALKEAAETDEYVNDKIAWEVSESTH